MIRRPIVRSERIYFASDLYTAFGFGVFCCLIAVFIGTYLWSLVLA